jgi:hypothetical protein
MLAKFTKVVVFVNPFKKLPPSTNSLV